MQIRNKNEHKNIWKQYQLFVPNKYTKWIKKIYENKNEKTHSQLSHMESR